MSLIVVVLVVLAVVALLIYVLSASRRAPDPDAQPEAVDSEDADLPRDGRTAGGPVPGSREDRRRHGKP